VKLEWKFCLSEAVPKLQFWNKLIKAAFSTDGENPVE
jgi:hypothetical protein